MTDTSAATASLTIYEFQPLTPAGTPEDVPISIDMTFPALEVDIIEWMVPKGPQGNLGWQLWYANSLVIPQNGTWVVTDGEFGHWEIDELPQTGTWQFMGYNTGSYDHTVYLRFLVSPLTTSSPDNSGLIVVPNWPIGTA